MRILVIEDLDDKFAFFEEEIRNCTAFETTTLTRVKTYSLATKLIYERTFEVIIIDLMVPLRSEDEDPQDITDDILASIELSSNNRGAGLIAISAHDDLVEEQRAKFTDAGVVLVHYREDNPSWRRSLSSALSRISQEFVFDFVVVCALEKERAAFYATSAKVSELRNIRGLDCLLMRIGALRGACIKLPRMGLVDAAAIATRAIERFSPKILAMSGICAGSSKNAELGQLVIADPCWEYQAGKWADDKFQIEHYDEGLEIDVKTSIDQFISSIGKGEKYKAGLLEDKIVFSQIGRAPMATGSAVIASAERMTSIEEQHRKIAALDMEMYGLYKAAKLSAKNPIFFGAKTVVDLADNAKGDEYHQYGSVLSARFVVEAIAHLHEDLLKSVEG